MARGLDARAGAERCTIAIRLTCMTLICSTGVALNPARGSGKKYANATCKSSEASSARTISRFNGLLDSTILPPSTPMQRSCVGGRDACNPAESRRFWGTMIDTNITLYQAEWCPYCARVRSRLTDLLLDYKNVNVPADHAQRSALKEISGQTGIPTLVDGDVIIADDDDKIIEYLNEKYAHANA